jgi:HEAT repeat protein
MLARDPSRITKPSFDDEFERLQSRYPCERCAAIAALAWRRDAESCAAVESALYDPDVDVVFAAAGALAIVGMPEAIQALIRLALGEGYAVARRVRAVVALGAVRDRPAEVLATLEWLTKRADPWLQTVARQVLADGRNPLPADAVDYDLE